MKLSQTMSCDVPPVTRYQQSIRPVNARPRCPVIATGPSNAVTVMNSIPRRRLAATARLSLAKSTPAAKASTRFQNVVALLWRSRRGTCT